MKQKMIMWVNNFSSVCDLEMNVIVSRTNLLVLLLNQLAKHNLSEQNILRHLVVLFVVMNTKTISHNYKK